MDEVFFKSQIKKLGETYGNIPQDRSAKIWDHFSHLKNSTFAEVVSEYIADNKTSPTRQDLVDLYNRIKKDTGLEIKTDESCQRCFGSGVVSIKLDTMYANYAFMCSACYSAKARRLNYGYDYEAESFAKIEGLNYKPEFSYKRGKYDKEFKLDPNSIEYKKPETEPVRQSFKTPSCMFPRNYKRENEMRPISDFLRLKKELDFEQDEIKF